MSIWPLINLFLGVCITSLGMFALMNELYLLAIIDLFVGFVNFLVLFLNLNWRYKK